MLKRWLLWSPVSRSVWLYPDEVCSQISYERSSLPVGRLVPLCETDHESVDDARIAASESLTSALAADAAPLAIAPGWQPDVDAESSTRRPRPAPTSLRRR